MTENKEIMARNIKFQMEKNGVNATELCKALDIKQNTFSDWVNAKNYPRIDKIEKMAQYFGISKALLVEDIQDLEVFTDDERKLIIEYRNADKVTQESVRRLLRYYQEMYGNGNR